MAVAFDPHILTVRVQTAKFSPERVRGFIRGDRTWFEEEALGFTPPTLFLTTRRHGNVGDEEPGQEDLVEARRLKAALTRAFPGVKVVIHTVDEWVNLDVVLGQVEASAQQYVFPTFQAAAAAGKDMAAVAKRRGEALEFAIAKDPRSYEEKPAKKRRK